MIFDSEDGKCDRLQRHFRVEFMARSSYINVEGTAERGPKIATFLAWVFGTVFKCH